MDWCDKAIGTAVAVTLLLGSARCFGTRMAGALAGLPTVTGPALVWLALDFGAAYAAEAALGSIAACVACAAFALAYERTSRRAGACCALGVACAVGTLAALPLQALRAAPIATLALAALVSLAACAAMPAAAPAPRRTFGRAREAWLTIAVATAVSALVAVAAPEVGAFWAGVLASPPLIAAVLAMHQHALAGHDAACGVLRGYVAGLLGRAVFGAAFAALVVRFGLPETSLAAAVAGCTCTFAAWRLLCRQRSG